MEFFRKRVELMVMCTVVSIGWMCCLSAVAGPVGYQGQLLIDGMPVSGAFDFECRVFDAVVKGVQLGETVTVEDQLVEDGLFSLTLEFDDSIDWTGAYLDISVRAGVSEDAYDTLTPRQLVTSTPSAITAERISGPGWQSAANGVLWNNRIDGRVLINRDEILSPVEYFGVNVPKSPIGGMIVSNEDPTGDTLYGYAAGGSLGASHVFDPDSNKWSLVIGSAFVLTAETSGLTAPEYRFTEPVTRAITIAGDVFHSSLGTPFRASFFGGGAYISEAGGNSPLVAPVQLPDKAVIKRFVARFEDNAPSDLTISLFAAQAGGDLTTIAAAESMGVMSAGIQSIAVGEDVIMDAVVDRFGTGYYIRAFSPSWPGDSSMRVWSVTIEYTIESPG